VPLSAQTYLLNEGFEGAGYENSGWSAFSTVDPDYTTTALAGSQSLRCSGTSSYIMRSLAPGNSFYCYFQIRWLSFAPYKFVVDWLDASSSSISRVITDDFPHKLGIVHGNVSASGSTALSANTTYHVWVEWTRSTGSDGTMKLFVSTTGIKPASPEANITTGNGTGTIAKFDIGPFDAAATTDVIYDRMLIDDEPIGSNPGGNSPPTITSIANQTTPVSTAIGPIPFTIGDAETNATDLVLTGTSSNTSVVPNGNIVFGGSASNRTVTITPNSSVTANTTITITVSDGQASNFTSFNLAVGNANTPSISAIANQNTIPNAPVGPLNFTIGDVETSAASLAVSGTSANTALVPNGNIVFGGSGSNRTVTLTPVANQSGVAQITVVVSDGQLTNSTSFTATISANTPPTISDIPNQTMPQDTSLGPINFTIGDAETAAASLTVSRASSNIGLLPLSGITLGGAGAIRTFTLTPASGQTGTVTVTLTVSDGDQTASDTFVLTVNSTGSGPGDYLFREGFEGPSYENSGWTAVGSPNPDYTANVLQDAQSLNVAGGSVAYRTFQPTNEFHLYCRLRWNNLVLGTSAFYWETAGYGAAGSLLIDYSAPRLLITHGGSSAVGTTALQPNVTYHVWVEWIQGTGSDGTMKVFLSGSPSKPASPEAILTNGAGGPVERMYVGSLNNASDMIADSIFIAKSPIGSNPGDNTAPLISDIVNQTINEDGSAGPLAFTIGDAETVASTLTVAGDSSNTTLVPNANILFGGSGSNRTVTITPVPNQSGSAIITVTVNDGVLTASDSFLVTANAVNDPPVVTLLSGSANYTENALPIILHASATVIDIDSPDFAGGTLTVDFASNGQPEDRLAIRNQGIGAGQIGVGGAIVTYEGVSIGTFAGGNSGSSPLIVSLNANCTPVAAQALLQNVTYENVSEIPSPLVRTVRAIIQDGDGGNSAPVTLALTVTAVPDAPGLSWANPAPIVYGTALSAAQLNATASVPGTFVYAPAAGAVLNAGAGQSLSVVFTPDDTVNYSPAAMNVVITVTPAPLTITADNKGRAYGAANPQFTATYEGFVNGDAPGGLDTPVTLTTIADTSSPVGNYIITATGATDLNYAITHVNGTLGVSAAPLVVTAGNQSKIYGAALPSLTGTLTGVLNGDAITANYTTTATAASDTGSYPITPALADPDNKLSNYSVTLNGGTLTITPAPLLITANGTNRLYGAANPAFTASYSGFVNGDTEASLDTPVTLGTGATGANPVGAYAITASGAGDLNYSITYAPGTLTITPAALLVTANNTNRPYGMTNPPFTVSYGGFLNGDDADDLSGTLAFTTLADTNSPIGDYFVTPSGLSSANYILSYAPGILTVTPAALRVTANSLSRAYGQINPVFTVTYTGFVNGDDENDLGGTLAFTSPAGIDSPVGVYPITPLGLTAPPNYVLSFVDGALTITAAPLIATADNQSKLYGAALPAFTGTLAGVQNGENITATFTTVATAGSNAGTYAITPVVSDPDNKLGNYAVTMVNGTLTVTPVPLTITAQNKSKDYGAALPIFTATYSGFVNGDTETSLDTSVTLATTANATSPAGVYPITATGAADLNYTITQVNGTLTITAVPLTITANNASRSYGMINPPFAATYSGFVNGDNSTHLLGTLVFTTAAETNSPVGTYPVTPSGQSSPNYAVSFVDGTLTITAYALVATADNQTKLYGAALPTLTGTLVGVHNGDAITATFTTTATAASNVSSYVITPVLSDPNNQLSNYTVTLINGTLSVTPAPLTITADDKSKPYGDALPTLTASYSGFVNGDTETSLDTPATLATTATAASNAGNYAITAAGASDLNYTVTLVNGTLSVAPVPLTITAQNQSKDYGAALPVFTATYSGFVNGDTETSLDTPVTLATTATLLSNAGSYPITATGASDVNYSITQVNGTLTVNPVPLTITANNASRSYGMINPPFAATYSGFVNGDDETDLVGTLSFITAAETNSPVGTYPVTPSGLSSPNYTVGFVDGTLTVTAYALVATANNQAKLYGAALPALTGTLVGVHNGDAITATFITAATQASDAGLYSIVPVLSDPNNMLSNYTVTLVNGTLTNLPAPLTIAADNKNRLYGAANPPLTASFAGFVNGDAADDLLGALVLTTLANANSSVGPYAITPSGLTAANYALTFVDGTLNVTAAALVATADNQTKLYGAALPTLTGTLTGVQNGDAITASFTTAATQASDVGTYSIISALADPDNKLGNYAVTLVNATLSITPAPLTITANDKTKTYGAANPPLTASFAGFVNGDDADDLDTPVSLSTTADASSLAGSYPITATGAADLNYTITFIPGTLTVTGAASVGIAIISVDAAGAPTLRLTSDAGRVVTLQATSNFTDWEDVITLPNITGTVDYIDAAAIGQLHRFYRARTP